MSKESKNPPKVKIKPGRNFKEGCHQKPLRLLKKEVFECGTCDQDKQERPYWSRVEGIGINPHQ